MVSTVIMTFPDFEDNGSAGIDHATETTQLLPKYSLGRDEKRDGLVTLWAGWGLVWSVTALQAVVRWILSTDFRAAPVLGPDEIATFRLVLLRVLEVISVGVWFAFMYFCVLAPMWTKPSNISGNVRKFTGNLGLDGKYVIGGMFAWIADSFLNCRQYLFAWNSHSVNIGVWTRFMPFHAHDGPFDYAEGILWGMPMYIYFCAGAAIVACTVVKALRRRWPDISPSTLMIIVWVGEFTFDFVLENLIIRSTHAYGFPKTYGPLTLFAGKVHQFPIYESIFVANLGSAFTIVRLAALDHPTGLSPLEYGYQRYPKVLQGWIRLLAVVGFCSLCVVTMYHLPLNWLGVIGDCMGDLPSYMLPGSAVNSTSPNANGH